MTDIHNAIRDHYGSIASDSGTCCNDDGCGCSDNSHALNLYGEAADALPFDVTGVSLGCGDPVTIASLHEGETVLDLGSGGGIDCFLAAKEVGDGGYVIGVDMTDDMLNKANANKLGMGVSNVEFRKGHIEDLPIKDNSIDVIMSNCVINLSPDKAAVFHEAFRVLKPGGRISISDIVTEGEFSDAMRADAANWAECVSGAIDMDEYLGFAAQAGFTQIQIVDKVKSEERGVKVNATEGVPRIFSARITAQKPV